MANGAEDLLLERPTGTDPVSPVWQAGIFPLNYSRVLELPAGVEPALAVYKTAVLPLNYKSMADEEGFEPSHACAPDGFQDHSLEPLGYPSVYMCVHMST